NYGMKLPIKPGDTGIALFCERSLQVWSQTGGAVDPADPRHHHLSDAVFVPGLYPFSQPFLPPVGSNPLDLVVFNGLAQIFLQPTGQFKIVGAGQTDVLQLMLQTLTQLQTVCTQLSIATTLTMLGPEPLVNAAAFAAVATTVGTLIAKLTTLLGV